MIGMHLKEQDIKNKKYAAMSNLRTFGRLVFFVTVFLLQEGMVVGQQLPANEKPNIVLIYADDMGYGDLSSYGGEIPTPNIDRIGRDGIRFTDFYVAAPVCTPSRYGLLTGSYPSRSQHGLEKILFPYDMAYFDKTEKILPAYLKDAGYITAICGKWHLGNKDSRGFPTLHGFDEFNGFLGGCIDFYYHTYGKLGRDWYVNGKPTDEEGYSTDLITKHALRFIDRASATGKPFFLYLTYNAPHSGKSDPDSLPENTITINQAKYEGVEMANTLQPPPEYAGKFTEIADPKRRAYAGMIANLDDNVGIVLNKLKKAGLLESTMIWFISDNGGNLNFGAHNGPLRGQKGNLYEGGIRIPAMVMWKNRIRSNQVIHSAVCNIDLLPTIAALAGIAEKLPAGKVDGIDIRNVLFHSGKTDREIFWKYAQKTALRSGDWKLVNGSELYDLERDQEEKVDLAAKYPERVQALRNRYREIENRIKIKY